MKLVLSLVLVTLISGALVSAQESADPQPSVEALRTQLLDVQSRESELQARARELEEALKPENIERALAGIGSTRPEELREQRRRQLTIERDGVLAQLKIVSTSRERLESVIRTVEAQAYQRSAEGNATLLNQTTLASSQRWLVVTVAGVVGVLALFAVFVSVRRANAA